MSSLVFCFFFKDTATTQIYTSWHTLSLHDALPISGGQFQRMANVALAAGRDKLSVADMIKDVENGIYIVGDGSFSIDQQRYNAQFGGQLFFEIKDGQITRMLEDVTYQRSEEHTSELQSLMRSSYAVCCLKKKNTRHTMNTNE